MNMSSNVQLKRSEMRVGHICSNHPVKGGYLLTELRKKNACPPAEPRAERQECQVLFKVTLLSVSW